MEKEKACRRGSGAAVVGEIEDVLIRRGFVRGGIRENRINIDRKVWRRN